MADGTPVSVAKRFIRQYDAGPQGYNAAWGYRYGLPAGTPANDVGFPIFEGRPIPDSMYGGKYHGMVSHAFGIGQFQEATWRRAAEGLAKEGTVIKDYSPESQEKIKTWLLMHDGMSHWIGGDPPYNAAMKAAYDEYKRTGKEPTFSGPLAYWEPGYKPGAATFSRPSGASTRLPLSVTAPETKPGTETETKPEREYDKPPSPEEIEGTTIRSLRGLYLLSMFNQMAQGRKLTPVPVDYDPWKVREVARGGQPSNYGLSVGVQGIGTGVGPFTKFGVYGS
jgi:hypothetical protein